MSTKRRRGHESIDLSNVRPVALPGGTVIFAQSHMKVADTPQIDAGEVPVCVAGVHSPTDLRNALEALDFDHIHIDRVLRHELRGENATKAVACAERQAGNAEVLSA